MAASSQSREDVILLSHALQAMSDAVILIDERRAIRYLNPAAERLTDWQSGDVMDKDCGEIMNCHDGAGNPLCGGNCFGWGSLLELEEVPYAEMSIRDRFGRLIPVSASHTPLPATAEHDRCVVIVLRDLTRKSEEEAHLREAQRELLQITQRRERDAERLNHLAALLAEKPDQRLRLDAVLEQIRLLMHADEVGFRLYLSEADAAALQLPRSVGSALVWPQGDTEPLAAVCEQATLQFGDERMAELSIGYRRMPPIDRERSVMLHQISYLFSLALASRLLQVRTQRFSTMEERARISREIHDSVAQTVAFCQIAVGGLRQRLEKLQPGELDDQLAQVEGALHDANREIRQAIEDLRLFSTDTHLGTIVRALDRYARNRNMKLHYDDGSEEIAEKLALPVETQFTLMRILEEALANVKKHAGVDEAELSIRCDEQQAVLTLSDQGHGFDPSRSVEGHYGLHTMVERAERIGAQLHVDSAPQRGTQVTIIVPLAQAA
ncbi:MAG: PAS domain S-box protein [Firmicutes bacterium]|nr:PAS domain S-box protein [Bacillota bacterium]